MSCSGHKIGPAYPVILYYNQIMGALVKIYVFFRLDQQSWTPRTCWARCPSSTSAKRRPVCSSPNCRLWWGAVPHVRELGVDDPTGRFRALEHLGHVRRVLGNTHPVRADNEIYRNHTDGITLYESGDNLLWGNKVIANRRHGIRVRNSVNIKLYENTSMANGLTGLYGHIKDLTDTDRDIALDPFDAQVSLIVVGGELAGNGSGPLSIDSPLSVELYRACTRVVKFCW